jgi:hypothetical protein
VSKLEQPAVRWAIASLFLGAELLLFVVVPDPGDGSRYEITFATQAVMMVASLVLFALIPSILKDIAAKDRPLADAADQVEATQQRRAAFVAGVVNRAATVIRIDTTAPIISWLAAGFLFLLAGGTITDSVAGLPARLLCATTVYLLLAAFAVPPVRGYLHRRLRVTFPRAVVVIVLVVGVLLNEAVVAPPTEAQAAVVAAPLLVYTGRGARPTDAGETVRLGPPRGATQSAPPG